MDTKEKILQTAEELFMRYGTRSVTMDDIAKELGMSKKTIYQFFKDKDAIVQLIMSRVFEEERQQLYKIEAESADPIEAVLKIAEVTGERIRNINPIVLYDLQKYHSQVWDEYNSFCEQDARASVVRNLKRGIEQGLYRSNLDPEVMATLHLVCMDAIFDQNITDSISHKKYDLGDLSTMVIEHFLRGIVTLEGFQLLEQYQQRKTHTTQP